MNCRRCGMPGASLHFPGGWLCDNGCDPNPIMKPTENDPEEGMDEIALRELVATLRSQLKSVEADAAVMWEALEGVSLVEWDEENAYDRWMQMHEYSVDALSTNAGKSLLERLKEAEALLGESRVSGKYVGQDWFDRRDAFLNPTNKDK